MSSQAALSDALSDVRVADARGAAGRADVVAQHSPAAAGVELVRLVAGG